MSPTEYLAVVVLPTAAEFMGARDDRRLAYLSCQSTFHLCDYIHRADVTPLGGIRNAIRVNCPAAFEVVEGVANGSKHCGRYGRGAFQHEPGSEREAMPFTVGHSFLNHDRLEVPGLEVEHDGRSLFIDECLRDFLVSARLVFPDHFAGVDLTQFGA